MSVPTDEIADLLKYLSCVPVDGLAENFVSIFARQLMGSHDYLTHRTGSVENSDEIPRLFAVFSGLLSVRICRRGLGW
jgi:hypothetical protein